MTFKSRESRGARSLDRVEQRRLLRQQRKVKRDEARRFKRPNGRSGRSGK